MQPKIKIVFFFYEFLDVIIELSLYKKKSAQKRLKIYNKHPLIDAKN